MIPFKNQKIKSLVLSFDSFSTSTRCQSFGLHSCYTSSLSIVKGRRSINWTSRKSCSCWVSFIFAKKKKRRRNNKSFRTGGGVPAAMPAVLGAYMASKWGVEAWCQVIIFFVFDFLFCFLFAMKRPVLQIYLHTP